MTETAVRVEIRDDRVPDAKEALALFDRLNWAKTAHRNAERFQAAMESSWPLVTAWEGARLVGICRVIADGQYTAYISDLAIDPDFQGKGIGAEVVERVLRLLEGYDTIALITGVDKYEFWEKFGFTNFPGAMMLRHW